MLPSTRSEQNPELLQALLDSSPQRMAAVDRSHRFLAFNTAFAEAFSYLTGHDLRVGDNCLAALADLPSVRDQLLEQIKVRIGLALQGETLRFTEALAKTPSDWEFKPLRNASGEIIGAIILIRSINHTQQQQLEQALRERNQLVALAEPAARVGFFRWNIDTDEAELTDGTRALLGLPRAGAHSAADFMERVLPDDVPGIRTAIDRAVTSGEYYAEFRVPAGDGGLRWIAGQAKLFYAEDGTRYFLGINIDITRQKRSEEALVRSEKLSAAGRLAAALAHEINNPLEAITNLLYLVRTELKSNFAALKYLQWADDQVSRVVQISRQTLSFYRDSTDPVLLDACLAADEVARVLAPKFKSVGVQLKTDLRCGHRIVAYAGELRQVLTNLLVNALDATPRGGTVRLRVHDSLDWRDGKTAGSRLTVSDSGHGITPEVLRSLGEPFFTTKGAKGVGLSVWVTKGIVHRHGGSLRIRTCTEPHRSGTSFSLFFPLEPRSPQRNEAERLHRRIGRELLNRSH